MPESFRRATLNPRATPRICGGSGGNRSLRYFADKGFRELTKIQNRMKSVDSMNSVQNCAHLPGFPKQRRESWPISSQNAEVESRNALECPANCRRDRSIEINGPPHLASVWLAATSTKTIQALVRSIFCRKSTGYCRAVFESS